MTKKTTKVGIPILEVNLDKKTLPINKSPIAKKIKLCSII